MNDRYLDVIKKVMYKIIILFMDISKNYNNLNLLTVIRRSR